MKYFTVTIPNVVSARLLPERVKTLDDAIRWVKDKFPTAEEAIIRERDVNTKQHKVDLKIPTYSILSLNNYYLPSEKRLSLVWEKEDEYNRKILVVPIWVNRRDLGTTHLNADEVYHDSDYFRECLIDFYNQNKTKEINEMVNKSESLIGLWAKQLIYRDRNSRSEV